MNNVLYQMLLELEFKFDMELGGYFDLSEVERRQLNNSLIKYFLPYLTTHNNSKETLMLALETIIIQSEQYEEYEKAAVFSRLLQEIRAFTF